MTRIEPCRQGHNATFCRALPPGNVANFWQPWKVKVATFWQGCQPLATLPPPGAFPPICLGSDSYRAAPTRSEPTWTSCPTRSRPSAHCQLPSAHCPLPTAPYGGGPHKIEPSDPPLSPLRKGGTGGGRRRTGPEAVSKRGLAHLPCGACPRFETASQRWPELAESVPREKMLSLFG